MIFRKSFKSGLKVFVQLLRSGLQKACTIYLIPPPLPPFALSLNKFVTSQLFAFVCTFKKRDFPGNSVDYK